MHCLDKEYPFLMNYFKNGINNPDKNIAHCILFYGSDLETQYDLAIEIARLLNCKGTKSDDCNCLNCNWIRENKHPAILTVSRVDNKPADDTSKTVISMAQARMIKNDLLITSEYHRVLIFCDKDDNGNICGLNRQNFQEEASNALLKTFEEPPSNTTFIFLTKDKSDMISTIVSRAQCFYVPSLSDEDRDYSLVQDLMDGYLELEKNEVLDFYYKLISLTKEQDVDLLLTQMQNYIFQLLKSNINNNTIKLKLISDLKSIETAKKENRLGIHVQTIFETLCFKMIL